MSLLLFAEHVAAFLSIGMACFSLARWGRPRTLYFTCYAITVAIFMVGALLEFTAHSLDAATVARKIQYFGTPFVGPFFFLFCMDYVNTMHRRTWLAPALLVFPVACTILVNSWPAQHLFYGTLSFSHDGSFGHLAATPGPVCYIWIIYNALLMLLGLLVVVLFHLNAGVGSRRHLAVFLVAFLFPLTAQLVYTFGLSGNWNLLPIGLTLQCTVLGWYLIRFRSQEWATIGRGAAVQQMKDAFILMDTKYGYLDSNAAAQRFFPALKTLQMGTPLASVPNFPEVLLTGFERKDDCEFTIDGQEGTVYMRASRTPLALKAQKKGIIILIYDNTENHHLLEELQTMATQDALTGLYNRGTFFTYANRDFDLCNRKHEAGSVLMMDIDFFKRVNDEHGHQAGDKVLVAIADILRARLRHTDIIGRYGGEELVVWLPDATREGAAIIADVIRRAVEHMPFESDKGRFHVTISIGVAGLEHGRHQTLDQLVAEADTALYDAKNEGRNKVCVYQRHGNGNAPAAPPAPQPQDAGLPQLELVGWKNETKETTSPADN